MPWDGIWTSTCLMDATSAVQASPQVAGSDRLTYFELHVSEPADFARAVPGLV